MIIKPNLKHVDRGQFQDMSLNFLEEVEVIFQDIEFPNRDSSRIPSEYESEALPADVCCSATFLFFTFETKPIKI
jgi:hypothetical protein